MFTAAELRAVFCGQPEVDLEVLKKATVYEGGVAATDRYERSHALCCTAVVIEVCGEEECSYFWFKHGSL